MNDKHLFAMAEQQFDDDCDEFEYLKDKVEEAIKKGTPLKYGAHNQFTTTIENCDLHDKVAMIQQSILLAYINDNDKELLKLIKVCCAQEINSLIDLIGD